MTARGDGHERKRHANKRMRDPLATLAHDSLIEGTPLDLLRAKTLSLLGLLSFFLAPFISASHFYSGGYFTGSVILGAGCSGLLAALLIKRFGALRQSGHILCAALWCGIGAGVYSLGFLSSGSLSWIALIPAIALLFGGLRVGLIWFAISWGIFMALELGLPDSTAAEGLVYQNTSSHRIITTTVYMVLLLGMLSAVEWVREWTFGRLREEEAQTKKIMQAFPDGIALISDTGEVLETNLAARRMFDEFGEEPLLGFAREMTDARADWSDGGVYLELEYMPIDDSPEDANSILIMRDVTATRLNALTLKRTMESASRASEAKTKFVAMLSHELRTPLNAVVGYSELIADSIEDGDTEFVCEDTQALQLATRHLRSLLDATLDLAKIESGKLLLDISEVSIPNMLSEVSRTLRPTIEEKGNILSVYIDEELDEDFSILTDNLKLRQVLINLLSNAAKFTENSEISLHAHRADDGIIIAVEDRGEGMSEQTLSRVWEEFVQADEAALSQDGGTGLGLALVKRLTHLIGGRIEVESTLGEGTIFTIELPSNLSAQMRPPEHREAPPQPKQAPNIPLETSLSSASKPRIELTPRG